MPLQPAVCVQFHQSFRSDRNEAQLIIRLHPALTGTFQCCYTKYQPSSTNQIRRPQLTVGKTEVLSQMMQLFCVGISGIVQFLTAVQSIPPLVISVQYLVGVLSSSTRELILKFWMLNSDYMTKKALIISGWGSSLSSDWPPHFAAVFKVTERVKRLLTREAVQRMKRLSTSAFIHQTHSFLCAYIHV